MFAIFPRILRVLFPDIHGVYVINDDAPMATASGTDGSRDTRETDAGDMVDAKDLPRTRTGRRYGKQPSDHGAIPKTMAQSTPKAKSRSPSPSRNTDSDDEDTDEQDPLRQVSPSDLLELSRATNMQKEELRVAVRQARQMCPVDNETGRKPSMRRIIWTALSNIKQGIPLIDWLNPFAAGGVWNPDESAETTHDESRKSEQRALKGDHGQEATQSVYAQRRLEEGKEPKREERFQSIFHDEQHSRIESSGTTSPTTRRNLDRITQAKEAFAGPNPFAQRGNSAIPDAQLRDRLRAQEELRRQRQAEREAKDEQAFSKIMEAMQFMSSQMSGMNRKITENNDRMATMDKEIRELKKDAKEQRSVESLYDSRDFPATQSNRSQKPNPTKEDACVADLQREIRELRAQLNGHRNVENFHGNIEGESTNAHTNEQCSKKQAHTLTDSQPTRTTMVEDKLPRMPFSREYQQPLRDDLSQASTERNHFPSGNRPTHVDIEDVYDPGWDRVPHASAKYSIPEERREVPQPSRPPTPPRTENCEPRYGNTSDVPRFAETRNPARSSVFFDRMVAATGQFSRLVYSGHRDKQHPMTFLHNFCKMADAHGASDYDRIEIFRMAMTKQAAEWMQLQDCASFEELTEMFTAEFWSRDKQADFLNVLLKGRYSPNSGESLTEYARRLIAGARYLTPQMSEENVLMQLVAHYPPKICMEMTPNKVGSISSFMATLTSSQRYFERLGVHIQDLCAEWNKNEVRWNYDQKPAPSNQHWQKARPQTTESQAPKDKIVHSTTTNPVTRSRDNSPARGISSQTNRDANKPPYQKQYGESNKSQQPPSRKEVSCLSVSATCEDKPSQPQTPDRIRATTVCDENGRPTLQIQVKGPTEVSDTWTALIDSGATVSCIEETRLNRFEEYLAQQLGFSGNFAICAESIEARDVIITGSIGNDKQQSSEVIQLTIAIDHGSETPAEFTHEFYVVQDLKWNAILGADFLRKFKGSLHFDTEAALELSLDTNRGQQGTLPIRQQVSPGFSIPTPSHPSRPAKKSESRARSPSPFPKREIAVLRVARMNKSKLPRCNITDNNNSGKYAKRDNKSTIDNRDFTNFRSCAKRRNKSNRDSGQYRMAGEISTHTPGTIHYNGGRRESSGRTAGEWRHSKTRFESGSKQNSPNGGRNDLKSRANFRNWRIDKPEVVTNCRSSFRQPSVNRVNRPWRDVDPRDDNGRIPLRPWLSTAWKYREAQPRIEKETRPRRRFVFPPRIQPILI